MHAPIASRRIRLRRGAVGVALVAATLLVAHPWSDPVAGAAPTVATGPTTAPPLVVEGTLTAQPRSAPAAAPGLLRGTGCSNGVITVETLEGVALPRPLPSGITQPVVGADGDWVWTFTFPRALGETWLVARCHDQSTAGAPTTMYGMPGRVRFTYRPVRITTTGITARVERTKLTLGLSTQVVGRISPRDAGRVTLQVRAGGDWRDTQGATVRSDGTFAIPIRPSRTGIYALRVRSPFGTIVSKVLYVKVSPTT